MQLYSLSQTAGFNRDRMVAAITLTAFLTGCHSSLHGLSEADALTRLREEIPVGTDRKVAIERLNALGAETVSPLQWESWPPPARSKTIATFDSWSCLLTMSEGARAVELQFEKDGTLSFHKLHDWVASP